MRFPCSCGSGHTAYPLIDDRCVFLANVCIECEPEWITQVKNDYPSSEPVPLAAEAPPPPAQIIHVAFSDPATRDALRKRRKRG